MVYQIVYSSVASIKFKQQMMPQILRNARLNNEHAGVTGLLIYANGSFLQVLEGRRDAVEERYSVIERDDRHSWLMRLRAAEVQRCNFSSWSMAWHNCTPEDEVSDLVDSIVHASDVSELIRGHAPQLDKLISTFADHTFTNTGSGHQFDDACRTPV